MPLFEQLWAIALSLVCVVLAVRALLSWMTFRRARRINELYQKALRELEVERIEERR